MTNSKNTATKAAGRKSLADSQKRDEAIAKIAAQILRLDTVETRNSDSLDFSDQAVWQIKAALEAAYNAGKAVR